MAYRFLADAVVVVHLAFTVFVAGGGLLVWRWPLAAWFHLPAVAWGAWVECAGRLCPLTPLENWLRHRSGSQGYSGGFIEHYLVPLLYPDGLTRYTQMWLGGAVLIVNLLIYGVIGIPAVRRKWKGKTQ